MYRRLTIAASASLLAWGPSAPATAQATGSSEVALEPIIVTARRQEEELLDTPVAVTAVEAEEIGPSAADTLERAVERAPNLLFSDQGGPISVRGITSPGISGGVDRQPAVGLFLDDVFLARPQGYPQFLEDIDRVEVVRGSQATLYGKNTIGGAVNLITRDPGFVPAGELSVTALDEPGGILRFSAEGAVSDSFALRGTISRRLSEGYIDNTAKDESVGDTDALSGQAVLQGTLANGTRVRLSGDCTKDSSDGGLWFAPVDDALDLKAEHDENPDHRLTIGGLTLRIEHDFGPVELTSITAYRGHKLDFFLDGDFTETSFLVQGQTEDQQQFSQEFRLTSTMEGPVQWTAGAYYLWEDFEAAQFFDMASVPRDLLSRNTFDQVNQSFAIYGTVDWQFAADWTLSGGVRYTHDRKSTKSEISSPSGTFFFGDAGAVDEDVSFNDISPELALSWRPTGTSLAYARISSGFKSGGISPYIEADGSANAYDPEKTQSAEIGYRVGTPDGRFSLAATAFYTRWQDQQVTIYTTPVTRVYRNAAESHSRGIELEGFAQLSKEFSLQGGYGYTRARFDSFEDDILGEDYSGNPLPFAPEHSAFLGLNWEKPLRNGLMLRSELDYTYRDSYAFNPDNGYRQDATHIVDARVSLEGDNWTASIFGRNLTDERYLTNYFEFFGDDTGVAAPGRTIGAEFTVTF